MCRPSFNDFTHISGKILFGTYDQSTSLFRMLAAVCMALYLTISTTAASSVGIGFGYFGASFLVTMLLMVPVARATFSVNQGQARTHFHSYEQSSALYL